MNKKELKFYEAPACEVVELKTSASLMVTSPGSEPGDGGIGGGTGFNDDDEE